MVRSFIGIEVGHEVRRRLAAYIETCSSLAPGFRWVPPQNLHLTLQFLDSVDASRVEALAAALGRLSTRAFDTQLGTVGTFGGARRPRVLWLEVRNGADELRSLASEVLQKTCTLGFASEDRPFMPHLTLARSRDPRGTPYGELPEAPALAAWRVAEVVLFRSDLRPSGAVYTALHRLPLSP